MIFSIETILSIILSFLDPYLLLFLFGLHNSYSWTIKRDSDLRGWVSDKGKIFVFAPRLELEPGPSGSQSPFSVYLHFKFMIAFKESTKYRAAAYPQPKRLNGHAKTKGAQAYI